jgi:hypothetical protein
VAVSFGVVSGRIIYAVRLCDHGGNWGDPMALG